MSRFQVLPALLLLLIGPTPAVFAQEPFIGEIRWVAFNFNPRGWANCDGQLLPINGHEALFSLLGTNYGGDGRTTFALPDLRGRMPMHTGSGPGLTPRREGEQGGVEQHTLVRAEIPGHKHRLKASGATAKERSPADQVLAVTGGHRHTSGSERRRPTIYADGPSDVAMDKSSITATGGDQPHENMPPFTVVRCIIALEGVFPARS